MLDSGVGQLIFYCVVTLIKGLIIVHIALGYLAYMTLAERKVIGWMQHRPGPNRAGPWGLLQPISDGIKLATKEFIVPKDANKAVFLAAPVVCLAFAIMPYAAIPLGADTTFMGYEVHFYIVDINIGFLYVMALSSLSLYGVFMAGWGSNSKYPLIGALRGIAQMISFEMPLILALVCPLMFARTLSLTGIVNAQKAQGIWYGVYLPIPFVIYFICAIAETGRVPFDLAEAEGDLVSGFNTEYSGMAFGMIALAEYINLFITAILAVVMFMGGWLRPFPSVSALAFLDIVPPIIWLFAKITFLMFVFIWVRTTLPRVRYDQLMYLGWKVLLPLCMVCLLVCAFQVKYDLHGGLAVAIQFVLCLMTYIVCRKNFYGIRPEDNIYHPSHLEAAGERNRAL